jgi:hypothetical protein
VWKCNTVIGTRRYVTYECVYVCMYVCMYVCKNASSSHNTSNSQHTHKHTISLNAQGEQGRGKGKSSGAAPYVDRDPVKDLSPDSASQALQAVLSQTSTSSEPDDGTRSTSTRQLFECVIEALIASAEQVETKNRDVIPLFFAFLSEQYYVGTRASDLDAPQVLRILGNVTASKTDLAKAATADQDGDKSAVHLPWSFVSSVAYETHKAAVDNNKVRMLCRTFIDRCFLI